MTELPPPRGDYASAFQRIRCPGRSHQSEAVRAERVRFERQLRRRRIWALAVMPFYAAAALGASWSYANLMEIDRGMAALGFGCFTLVVALNWAPPVILNRVERDVRESEARDVIHSDQSETSESEAREKRNTE